jgi:hypothetical protein
MEKISTMTGRAVQSIESTQRSAPGLASANSEKRYNVGGEYLTVMELLWRRMTEIYGSRWESSYGDQPTDGWATAIGDLSPGMIRAGLAKMAKQGNHNAWPPTALEFRALCIPSGEDIGLPSLDEAFQQAIGNRTEKHPAVVHTLRHLDSYALRRMPGADAQRAFARAWQKTIGEIAAGGELPAAPIGLSDDTVAKPKRHRTPEEAARCSAMLAGILASVGGQPERERAPS